MDNIFDLTGKSILVTGASSGLGRHFAVSLAKAGAAIVGAARREDALAALVAEIGAAGGKAYALKMDVTDMGSVRDGVAEAVRLTGGLDGLVNNAGVNARGPLLEQTEANWDKVMNANLKGVFAVGTEVARAMVARGKGGSIVNIASLLSFRQTQNTTPYAVSKAGVVQLTQQMALELAEYGIRVNAVAPGYFETDLNRAFLASEAGIRLTNRIPMGRTGNYDELTGPMLLLLSDAGSYITGSTISVDGGHRVNSF
ncbi:MULTISPECIES: glucose 1-dehydrogenase [Rhodomicrobium]|uniref:SDR family NAD(P)-dependent oxidoreductase n=1 Tax=Rhodomicrobium TaxID=1068 RepID=UPI000B4BBA07|nr:MULTISPECIES: glucose 1-dehydrogenase [Rhodomicrobium]